MTPPVWVLTECADAPCRALREFLGVYATLDGGMRAVEALASGPVEWQVDTRPDTAGSWVAVLYYTPLYWRVQACEVQA